LMTENMLQQLMERAHQAIPRTSDLDIVTVAMTPQLAAFLRRGLDHRRDESLKLAVQVLLKALHASHKKGGLWTPGI